MVPSPEVPSSSTNNSSTSSSSSSKARSKQTNTQGHYVFLAGAVSGVAEGITIQPLEMLKTRFQIHQGAPLRLLPTVRDIIAEGGIQQLYRGGLPEITGLIPRAAAALSTLEMSRRWFRSRNEGQLPAVYAYVSGALAGVTEGVVFSPFQVVKVRLMAKEHLGRYRNTWDCARQVVTQEGVGALATGLVPTLYRNCIWNFIYYGTMHQLEEGLPHLDSHGLQVMRQLLLGTGVGMMATCFNAPFDVVKSRVQSQLPHQRKYTSVFPTLVTIYKEEGPRALYKGFVPKALRLGVGQSVGLVMFERLLKAFHVEDQEAYVKEVEEICRESLGDL